jgi:hypothetical protein
MALRFMIFGSNTAAYTESGKLFGIVAYDDWRELGPRLRFLALADNVGKNAVAAFLPIFDGVGGLWTPARLLTRLGIWLPTVGLVLLSLRRSPSTVQKLAVLVICINAVLHYAVFRYRVLYVPQLAICLFVAAAPLSVPSPRRNLVMKLLACTLLITSVVFVGSRLRATLDSRYEKLHSTKLTNIVKRYPGQVDANIVEQVLKRYER